MRFVRVGADCRARFLRHNTGRLAAAHGAAGSDDRQGHGSDHQAGREGPPKRSTRWGIVRWPGSNEPSSDERSSEPNTGGNATKRSGGNV